MLYTTIERIKEEGPCYEGMDYLHKKLGKDFPEYKLISIKDIDLNEETIDFAIWALRTTTECSKSVAQELALWCAEEVLPIYEEEYPNDKRVRECIEVTKKYLNGDATLEDLIKARRAADAADAAAADAAAAAAAYAASAYAASNASNAAASAADAYAYAAKKEFELKLVKKFKELLNKETK